jgi:hypothetical protein
MAKEFFKNLPDTSTPINASRLNGLLNGNEAMGNIVVGDVKCKNLFNKGTIVNGWLNYANNVLMETHQSNYVTSDYISVKPNTTYTLNLYNSDNLGSGGIMFYDGAKNWISPGIPETQTVITFTTTPDTEYVRFVLRNDAKDNVQLEEGTTATEYTPNKAFGMESGSNSNGSWVKFEDGTMLFNKRQYYYIPFKSTQKWGSMWESDGVNLGDFPVPFISPPDVGVTIRNSAGGMVEYILNGTNTNIGNLYMMRPIDTNKEIEYVLSITAIGKWK